MNLGNRLKYLRNEHKIERQYLADAVGITYHALSKYETNDRQPDYETLIRIADFFKVPIDYLLGQTDDPSPKETIRHADIAIKVSESAGAYNASESDIDKILDDAREALKKAVADGSVPADVATEAANLARRQLLLLSEPKK